MLILSKDLYFRRVDFAKMRVCDIDRRKKRILCKKALVIRVFLYRVSERTYNLKSDDLEICRV